MSLGRRLSFLFPVPFQWVTDWVISMKSERTFLLKPICRPFHPEYLLVQRAFQCLQDWLVWAASIRFREVYSSR